MPEEKKKKEKKRESRQIFPGRNEGSIRTSWRKESFAFFNVETSGSRSLGMAHAENRTENGGTVEIASLDVVLPCTYLDSVAIFALLLPRFLAMIKNVFASRLWLLSVMSTRPRVLHVDEFLAIATLQETWHFPPEYEYSWNRKREKILFKLLASSKNKQDSYI